MNPVRNLLLKIIAKREWRIATPFLGRSASPNKGSTYSVHALRKEAQGQISNGVNRGFTLIEHECSKNVSRNEGFTLIELVVVIGIIVLLTALVLPNYRVGDRQLALQRSAHKLTQDIRRVEELAMSAKTFQGQVPQGGYGVYFEIAEKDHYILFADLNGNYQYDVGGSDGLVEDVLIEKEVQISQLSAATLNVIFTPPDPDVTIEPAADSAQITLAVKTDLTQTKTVTVNKIGLVYIGVPPEESCITCYADTDGDGYYSKFSSQVCGIAPSCSNGYSGIPGNDCDDGNGSIYPGTSGGLTCSICQEDGNISYQASSQDLFNECEAVGCSTGDCEGASYACGHHSSGGGNCPTCQTCEGSTDGNCVAVTNYAEGKNCTAVCRGCLSGACVNIPDGEKDTYGASTCTATHYRCNGSGSCRAPKNEHICADHSSCTRDPMGKACCQQLGYEDCEAWKTKCGGNESMGCRAHKSDADDEGYDYIQCWEYIYD